jgi:fumarate hydratase class II
MKYRIEKDSLGEVKVPVDALWGAQTQRAVDNFQISGIPLRFPFGRTLIETLGIIKLAAVRTNLKHGLIQKNIGNAIEKAAIEVINGVYDNQFPVDIFQTGSGTSTNMNANEVIANVASKKLKKPISPNDHVNMSQSSNDVIPTAIHISALLDIKRFLIPSLEGLIKAIHIKKNKLKGIVKTGRTHLMDAMPIEFSQELSGWEAQLIEHKKDLVNAVAKLSKLPQGGTAIGTGINAPKTFGKDFAREVQNITKYNFSTSPNYFMSISSQDAATHASSIVKNIALTLMKIANDLRLMNSGPLTGLGEIELEALQPGSSIMPGKVNPVVSESVIMAGADILGNDLSISYANQSGNFQLNVALPLIAYCLLKSIRLAYSSCDFLAEKGIKSFKVNLQNINAQLDKNPILVTALNREIGYAKAAEIAKKAYKDNKPIIDVAEAETNISRAKLVKLLDPKKLTKGGL